MSSFERGVFGLLAGSVGIGLYQLVASPWGEYEEKRNPSQNIKSKCPMKNKTSRGMGDEHLRVGPGSGTTSDGDSGVGTKVQFD